MKLFYGISLLICLTTALLALIGKMYEFTIILLILGLRNEYFYEKCKEEEKKNGNKG